MKQGLATFALLCVLSITALAGDIPSVGIAPPPPPPPDEMQATTTTAPGEIPTSGLTYEITDTTLDLIQMLLGFGV